MRKILSLVLAFALILGSFPLAFADAATSGAQLQEWKIVQGDLMSDVKMTRAMAITYFVRLLGEEPAALAYAEPTTFTDVPKTHWAYKYIAYAEAKKYTNGKGAGLFGLNDEVLTQEISAFVVRGLGYGDVAYADVMAKAAELKLLTNVTTAATEKITRGVGFELLINALNTPLKGQTVALKYVLKLATLPVTPVTPVASVVATNTTTVVAKLPAKVDTAAATNFTIAGITVQSATLDAAGTEVTLAVSPLKPGTTYTLKVSGLKTNAVAVADAEYTFLVPAVTELYKPTLTVTDKALKPLEVIKADGASQAFVTFELKDAKGVVMTTAQNVEVQFSTTFGSFAQNRVALEKGKASLLLTSEFLQADRTADLRAIVIEAQDSNLIGLKAEAKIIMSPNPEAAAAESLGASMTSAESNQADRVTVYFNKAVDRAKFVKTATGVVGDIDSAKAVVEVRKDSTSSTTGTPVTVKGIMTVPGNANALIVMLDVDAFSTNALTDNAPVFVSFTDKTGTVAVARTTTFNLTDARKPAMLRVENETLKKLVVTFSEAVDTATAKDLLNWSVDGIQLSNAVKWGTVTVSVGQFTNKTGLDARNVVTITLGANKYLTSGNHSIQASNIGDWAIVTPDVNNAMVTQTLDFVIAADTAKPVATVEVMSPEQWLITFNRDFEQATLAGLTLEVLGTNGAWSTDTMNANLVQTKIDDNKILVETSIDWTARHLTTTTNKNHFNYSYRLNLPKEIATNVANGLKNDAATLTLGGALATPDVTSPVISNITKNATGAAYTVVMSEPVKLPAGNNEGNTLAQTQTSIPTPTADFIKADYSKTVTGTVSTTFADDYDKELTVTPNATLEAGEWILVVRSVSDDIGNTAASITKNFTVTGAAAVALDFRILWVDAEHNPLAPAYPADQIGKDVIHVKFSKAAATFGNTSNALATTNYTLNGLSLPQGTQIVANIFGYDNYDAVTDSITIILPNGYLRNVNGPHVLNVSAGLMSTASEALVNPGEKLIALVGAFNKTTANVATVAELKAALADSTVYTINTTATITLTEALTIPRNINLVLGGNIVTDATNTLTLAHSLTGRTEISGAFTITKLTANTPLAELTVNAGVIITTLEVKALFTNTLTNYGTIVNLVIQAVTNIVNNGTITNMTVATATTVTFSGTAPALITGSGIVKSTTASGVAATFAVTTQGAVGAPAVATITVTAGATATSTIYVNVNGVVTPVAVVAGDTTTAVAAKIAAALNVTGYTDAAAAAVVTLTATVNELKTATITGSVQ